MISGSILFQEVYYADVVNGLKLSVRGKLLHADILMVSYFISNVLNYLKAQTIISILLTFRAPQPFFPVSL